MQAVVVVTGPESVVVSSFAVVPIFSVVDLSSSAVVPIFSVVAASVAAAVVSSVFVVVWIVDLSVVEYVEYGYWQVPSFPQVPWPLHVVAGLHNTNINEKRVNLPLNLKRMKTLNLLEQSAEKY